MGRPSKFSITIGNVICERLAEGQSLRSICNDDALPDARTVFRWLSGIEEGGGLKEFRQQYARAREVQADVLVDEILEISDDASNDWMERSYGEDAPVGWQVNGEHIQRSRLRVDSRKWFASKVAPKKYGDRAILSGDQENPVIIQKIERVIVDKAQD